MPRSPADRNRRHLNIRVAGRLREALCLEGHGSPGLSGARGTHGARDPETATCDHGQRGSAVVEFTFLGLLLMVPVVYFIITDKVPPTAPRLAP